MQEVLNARALMSAGEVEARTGVQAVTLRQWERRYGLPNPERGQNGYRLYRLEDIECINFLKAQIESGVAVSRAVELYKLERAVKPAIEHALVAHASGLEPFISELTEALIDAEFHRAESLLAKAYALFGVEEVMLDLMQPALVEIGSRWHEGKITIAHEHQASNYLRGKLYGLLETVGQPIYGPTLVVACAPSEWHELGSLMLAVLCRRAGMRVRYLGANTPLLDLFEYAQGARADAVLISVGSSEAVKALRAESSRLKAFAIPIVYGGAAIDASPDLAAELGGEYFGPGVLDALKGLVRRLA